MNPTTPRAVDPPNDRADEPDEDDDEYNSRACCDRRCVGGCGRPSCECECPRPGQDDEDEDG